MVLDVGVLADREREPTKVSSTGREGNRRPFRACLQPGGHLLKPTPHLLRDGFEVGSVTGAQGCLRIDGSHFRTPILHYLEKITLQGSMVPILGVSVVVRRAFP